MNHYPCNMTHTPPFDFAQCETHDTTFPLGEKCRFDGRDPADVYFDEAKAQRGRAVVAEMKLEGAEELARWFAAERDWLATLNSELRVRLEARTVTSDNIGEICWTPGTIIRAIKTGAVYELVRYAHWNTISGPASNSGYIDLPAIVLWSPAVSA